MFEDYSTKENALEVFFTWFLFSPGDKIQNLDKTIMLNNVSMIEAWAMLNGGVYAIKQRYQENPEAEDYVFSNLDNLDEESLTNEDLKLLSKFFSKPNIHGNNQQDFILVPICSFGTKVMKECSLFQPSNFDVAGSKKCFTFNENFLNPLKGDRVGPDLGLNFLLSYRMPLEFRQTNGIDLILHEPGVAPDIHGRTNTFMKIEKGLQYSIGTEATLIEVTESFKQMDLSKRECIINGNDKYHEVNCYFEQMIDFSIEKCKCIPWYMQTYQNESLKICTMDEFTCFESTTNDKSIQELLWNKCYPACTYIQYSLNVNKMEELKTEQMGYPEIKADVLGKMMDVRGTYETPFSLVQINFGSPRATVITQDAKVTFADMVGSIGGTFGVFLGISFVSLVDELVEWCLWLKQRF